MYSFIFKHIELFLIINIKKYDFNYIKDFRIKR